MAHRTLLAIGCLASLTAFAQAEAVATVDLSRGVTLPPTSAALVSEATAPAINPGGLTYVGAPQLFYLHERNVARDQVLDGVFVGDTLFGSLGLGASLEWIRSAGGIDYRRTTYALSAGSSTLSLGAGFHLYSSNESSDLDGLTSFDLGLTVRPVRALSLALVARNLDQPSRGAVTLARQLDVGIGIRPFGERLSIGLDYLFDTDGGVDEGRFGYALVGRILPGLSISAGASHGLRPADPFQLQLGVTLDTSNLGLTYAAGGASAGMSHVLALRASSQRYPSLTSGGGSIALFDLDDLLVESTSPALSLLGVRQADPYLRLTRLLDGAIRDPNLRGVVLKLSPLEGGLGKAEELRQAVLRLRAAGKRVIAVLFNANDAEYLIASAADRIYAVPQAILFVDGLSASATFFGEAMDELGIRWDVARVGAYKNAPDALTRREMSPEQREAINAYLDTDVEALEAAIAQGRSLRREQVRAAIAEGLKTPQRAKELGLVDEVISPTDLDKRLDELVPGARFDPGYSPRAVREDRWGRRRRVAIVPVIGNIAGGKSREDPLGLAEIAGAETVIRALEAAADDPTVKAIVVRVDSPGGDGLASDLIYRAVIEAKKKKPVVASMGDVAASGGYYAAMAADEIFAEPTTITGSIGVFLLKPAVQPLAERLGVRQETIQRYDFSELLSLYHPWSPAERAVAQKWIDAFYADFVSEVAASRKLSREQVDAVARGRVWSGKDALARKLVDTMGGLLDAVDAARRRAGIPAEEDVELVLMGEAHGLFASGAGEPGVAQVFAGTKSTPALPPALARLARELGLDRTLLLEPGVKAMMEHSLTVR